MYTEHFAVILNYIFDVSFVHRLHNVSSNKYLELAKLDYMNCQELHLREWFTIQKYDTMMCAFKSLLHIWKYVLINLSYQLHSVQMVHRMQPCTVWDEQKRPTFVILFGNRNYLWTRKGKRATCMGSNKNIDGGDCIFFWKWRNLQWAEECIPLWI